MTVHQQARNFDDAADAYERGRPGYPPEVVAWLAAELGLRAGRTVLDVGAGTGKLTRALLATGATVLAVEPLPAMREVLERVVPEASALAGTAEALPLAAESVDAITAAAAFHWFEASAALAEFHRVLGPGGRLAVIWNRWRSDEPLLQEINSIIGPYRRRTPSHRDGRWRQEVERTGLFAPAAETQLQFEQELDADGLVDRVGSISFVAGLPEAERAGVLGRIRELGTGVATPIRLGYVTEVFVFAPR